MEDYPAPDEPVDEMGGVVEEPFEGDPETVHGKPKLGLIWRYGWKYLRLFPALLSLFTVLSVISAVIMLAAPLLFGKITNSIIATGAASSAEQVAGEAPPAGTGAPGEDALPAEADAPGGEALPAGADVSVEGAASADGDGRGLLLSYALWLGCAVGGIALGLSLSYVQAALDIRMGNVVREQLFGRIIRQDQGFFHANETGRLTLIVNQMGVETQIALREIVLDPFLEVFRFLLSVGGLVYSFAQLQRGGGASIFWVAIMAVFCLALLSPLAMKWLGKRLQASSARVLDLNMAAAGLVNGSLKSPEEVQAFNAEEYFVGKFRRMLDQIRTANLRQTLVLEGINTINSLPGILIEVLFVGVALLMLISNPASGMQAGYLISILMIAPQILGPIQAVSNYIVLLRNSWPSVATVLSILEEPLEAAPAAPAEGESKIPQTLEARGLAFRYRPDLPYVFDGASFTAPAGKITGLVAKMGQGKTTFFRLALGFYQPERGQILFGGHPVNSFPLAELRKHAAMLSQFPAFFHDSLRDNLRVAKQDASDEELRAQCEQTGIWPILIEKVSDTGAPSSPRNPLDRPFGAAMMLSGGQKKLLALTRCLLRSPAFLFLDEPTTGMDSLEKYGLVEHLKGACQGKTVMVVDHDIPWLLSFCDYFVVLDHGRIVQQGTGDELLAVEGLFRDLYRTAAMPHGNDRELADTKGGVAYGIVGQ